MCTRISPDVEVASDSNVVCGPDFGPGSRAYIELVVAFRRISISSVFLMIKCCIMWNIRRI